MIALLLAATVLQGPARWHLRTDDTEAVLAVEDNRPFLLELRSTMESRSWLRRSEVPLLDHVWVGGTTIPVKWSFAGESPGEDSGSIALRFHSDRPPIDLFSIWRARSGAGPIEHHIEIVNHSTDPVTIPDQDSLDLGSLDPGGASEIGWERRGASNALTEGGVFQQPAEDGAHLDLVSDHHNPSSPVPWMDIQTGSTGGLYVGWEFSGLGHVEASVHGAKIDLRAGLMPDFRTDIRPGETLRLPGAFVGCYQGDIDAGSRRLGLFVLQKLRANPRKSFPDPVLVVNEYIDGGGADAKEDGVLRSLRFAHNLGMDAFMCDAMWFPAVGDWRWDPNRFPNGGAPIVNAVHADRMKFGLWSSWSNGGISTDPGALSVRGPYGHPDWFERNVPADWQPGPYYGVSACMGDEDAKKWAIAKTQQIVGDSKVDLFKTDVHPMVNECVQTDHRHRYGTDVGYWSCMGVYEVWDKLRARYPNLVLENCSGASHIKDFGVLQRCAYTVTTDTLSNLPDRAGIYDSTFILPPSALMTYTYENGYNLPGDEPGTYLFRSAMATAWQLAPTNSANWSENSIAAGIASVRTYKEWLRPILKDCEVHHVLPRPDGKRWDGMFYWSPNLEKGTLFVFRPDSEESRRQVRLAGLDPTIRYLLWSEDGSFRPFLAKGEKLMAEGVHLQLPTKYSSDLVHVQSASVPLPPGWGKVGEMGPITVNQSRDAIESHATLKWHAVGGARSYRVLVSANADLSKPTVDMVVYTPSISVEKEIAGQTYFYRVKALTIGGESASEVRSFQAQGPLAWDGRFLSDMPFLKAEAGSDHVHRDENYRGTPLSINGVVQRKGLWTHSFNDGRPADIVVDLTGEGYAKLVADVGLDDASGGGSVQFQVLSDGRILQSTAVLHPKETRHLDCDMTGLKQITLRVLNGGDGYTSDHAVWGMARLLRAGAIDPFSSHLSSNLLK